MSNLATAALGRSLARGLLRRGLLGGGLAGRSLLGCCLLGRSLARGLLGCRFLDSLLGRSRLGCLLGGRLTLRRLGCGPLRSLLGRGLLCVLLARRLLHGLAGAARGHATFHCWSFRREALCPRDNRFELSAGSKRRHGGGLNFHRLAGARIARDTGCTTALLENAETCNGDAVTLMHRTHDGVDDVFHRRGCLPTIRAQFLREYVDELRFVHAKPPKPVVLFGPTRGHGKPIAH